LTDQALTGGFPLSIEKLLLGPFLPAFFCTLFLGGALVGGIDRLQTRNAMTRAQTQLDRGLGALAVDTLDARRRRIATDTRGCSLLVTTYARANRADLLEWASQACLDAGVETPEVFIGLANANHSASRDNEAFQVLTAGLKKQDHSWELWQAVAQLLRQNKRNDDALVAYQKAIEFAPPGTVQAVSFETLQFLAGLDRWKDALPIANRLKGVQTENPEVYLLIARALAKGGDPEGAAPLAQAVQERMKTMAPEARGALDKAYSDVLGSAVPEVSGVTRRPANQ
jgi:predicted Zn-dependent protease